MHYLELYGHLCITAGVAQKMNISAQKKRANATWAHCLKEHAKLKTRLARELQQCLSKEKFKLALRKTFPVGESSAVQAAHKLLNYNPSLFATHAFATKEAVLYAVYAAHKGEEGGERVKKWHALATTL